MKIYTHVIVKGKTVKKRIIPVILCIALALVMLTACSRKPEAPTPDAAATAAPQEHILTPDPDTSPAPLDTPVPTPPPVALDTPTPAAAAPTPTAAPTTAPSAPSVTKSPTDESISEGGSCMFIARADNAASFTWHFVSPDGGTDVAYDSIASYFPSLGVSGGTTDILELIGVPAEFNGWRVYCRFSNSIGSTSSGNAVVSVSTVTPVPDNFAISGAETESLVGEHPDNYSGTYYGPAERGRMTIIGGPDNYNVTVDWSLNPAENSIWTFSGTFDDSGTLIFNDCSKTTTTYYEDGTIKDSIEEFSGASGTLSEIGGNGLIWSIPQDNAVTGTIFE